MKRKAYDVILLSGFIVVIIVFFISSLRRSETQRVDRGFIITGDCGEERRLIDGRVKNRITVLALSLLLWPM
jgi:hypothetical protein